MIMKMQKIKTVAVALASLTLITTGCNDLEFLTENPETFYTKDNIFTSSGQIEQALIAGYNHVRNLVVNAGTADWIYAMRFNGTDMFDVASMRRNTSFNNYGTIGPDHKYFNSMYTNMYELISKMNLVIESANRSAIFWSDPKDKEYAIAQAKFFRAFAYRVLGELFGGVPIVLIVITTPRYDFERSTRLETYQCAIDDLEAALPGLPETTSQGGRIVRGAAQHYLCELYLAKGIQLEQEQDVVEAKKAYEKSIEYADDVIDGGIYSLMKERFGTRKTENPIFYYAPGKSYESVIGVTEGNVYWDLFQEGNVNYQDGNKECIWAAQVNYKAYKAEDKNSKLPYSRAFSPVMRGGAAGHVDGTLEDVGGRGISIIMPTMYTRDEIYAGKWGDDMRNSEAVFRRKFIGNVATSPYYGKVAPYDELLYKDDDARSRCYPVSCKIATDKYTGTNEGEDMSNLFRDDYIIRLSETYLLRAEAKMRSGNKSGAADDINEIRRRAKCGYEVTAADVNAELILDERARELVYEEWRWNTLLRMGDNLATTRIRKYAYWPDAQQTLTFDFNLFPIPQTVIDANKDVVLEQNPEWKGR